MRDECKDLPERLLELLGKAEKDPVFQKFLSDFKTHFEVQTLSRLRSYGFKKLGFTIDHDAHAGVIYSVVFHMNTASVKAGCIVAYSGMLPYGIKPTHTRAEISSILGGPSEAEYHEGNNPCEDGPTWWDTYEMPPLSIGLIFDSEFGDLGMFSVYYDIDDKSAIAAHRAEYELNIRTGARGKRLDCSFCNSSHNGVSCFVIECEATGICHNCLDKFETEFYYPNTALEFADNCSFCLPLAIKHLTSKVKVIRHGSYSVCEVCADALGSAARNMVRISDEPVIAEPDVHFPAFGPEE